MGVLVVGCLGLWVWGEGLGMGLGLGMLFGLWRGLWMSCGGRRLRVFCIRWRTCCCRLCLGRCRGVRIWMRLWSRLRRRLCVGCRVVLVMCVGVRARLAVCVVWGLMRVGSLCRACVLV